MDMQYIQGGCRITPIVTALLRRIEAAKDGYLRSVSIRRSGDARRGDEAVSLFLEFPSALTHSSELNCSSQTSPSFSARVLLPTRLVASL